MRHLLLYSLAGLALIVAACGNLTSTDEKTAIMSIESNIPDNGNYETATLGAGCFWCVEAIYQRLEGVVKVESGYSGGHVANPTYRQVCAETTGHAEVVQVTFDPAVISFEDILTVFFYTHDPTTLNQQGADKGTQYRSAIFYHSEAQRETAEKVKAQFGEAAVYDNAIVTEITKFDTFYEAEDYHQNYYNENGSQGYCRIVINPKVEKFKKQFADRLREKSLSK